MFIVYYKNISFFSEKSGLKIWRWHFECVIFAPAIRKRGFKPRVQMEGDRGLVFNVFLVVIVLQDNVVKQGMKKKLQKISSEFWS